MPFSHLITFCFIYIFGSLVTAYLMLEDVLDYPFYVLVEPGTSEFFFISVQIAVFFTTLSVGYMLMRSNKIPLELKSNGIQINRSNRRVFNFVILICLVVFLTIFHWSDMVVDTAIRHAGNQSVARLTLVAVLVFGVIFRNERYVTRLFLFFLLIYIGTIDSAIGASRVAAVPFLMASLLFFRKKNFITGIILAVLALIALRTAFAARGDPSYFNFWNIFFEMLVALDFIDSALVIIQYSFPGLSTVQVSINESGDFSIVKMLQFLLYVSPVPSVLLPDSLFYGASLSGTLGIDRTTLGINQDIYSEGIYWFGVESAWIYTMTLGVFVLMPYFIANKFFRFIGHNIYLACFLVNLWMLVGGQVFTLRAGSRAVFAFVILIIIFSVFKRLRFRKKSVQSVSGASV